MSENLFTFRTVLQRTIWFLVLILVLCLYPALETEVSSWGGVIVTPGPKAYEKQQDQEEEEGENEGEEDDDDSSELSGQEQAEEKMETNQESWIVVSS